MALLTYTLTGNLTQLLGDQASGYQVFIESSVTADGVIYDRANHRLLLGDQQITPAADGSFSVSGLVGFSNYAADVSPTGIQYRVWVLFRKARDRTVAVWNSGLFGIDANRDLADIAPEQYLAPTYQGEFFAAAEQIRTSLVALRDQTQVLRDQAAALVVADLGTSDGQISTLLATGGSASRAAVVTVIDEEFMPFVLMGVI
ncbi:MAG: hypothetical protein F2667_13035 [Actinobacteria bacterium]|uniref:Unannotated protein n=1 Tax=freshwater metagenome TaxID=449393 RepID=A0A6J6S4E1_9ZZZZ|nr:hypothetical protein [Actinomycetota bacterium]